jgi:hypothetical protein
MKHTIISKMVCKEGELIAVCNRAAVKTDVIFEKTRDVFRGKMYNINLLAKNVSKCNTS